LRRITSSWTATSLRPILTVSMPNSGLPRGAEAWAKTSRLAAASGPIEL